MLTGCLVEAKSHQRSKREDCRCSQNGKIVSWRKLRTVFLREAAVKLHRIALFGLVALFLTPTVVMAQGFGEYGRSLGGAAQRQSGVNSGTPGGSPRGGKSISNGVGALGGRPVPSQLIVASKEAALYPRQDDEAEKIASLVQGEVLFPLVQSVGGNDWYMVKTTQGLIGWVKSSDVR